MSTLYSGDLHGRIDDLGSILQFAEAHKISAVIQVGDFGLGFPDKCWNPFFEKRARQQKWTVPIYTCAGNHDNHDWLDQLVVEQGYPDKVEIYPGGGLYFVPRGQVLEIDGVSHLFLGGAESTDRHVRVEGVSWWAREEPNAQEFDKFFEALENQKPNTVITHEAPLRIKIDRVRRNQSYTPNMLEKALKLSEHQPSNWLFGHHHILDRWKIEKTKFFGCGLHGQFWLREDENGGWSKHKKEK